jgi:hypothetical protein
LIEEYLVTQEEFELNFTEKQKQYKEERESKQSDWKKEQERYQAQIGERNREVATEQLRDEEQYEYQWSKNGLWRKIFTVKKVNSSKCNYQT